MTEQQEIKRTYTVPLRRGYANTPRYKRTHKAVLVLKKFLAKHMKSDNVKIGKNLNEKLWQNGIKNPPSKVKVIATKDAEGMVRVELEGKDYVDFKVLEKVDKNQSFKEKLQTKVADAKAGTKKAPEEKAAEPAAETKEAPKAPAKEAKPKAAEKPAEKKAEAPATKSE